MDFKDYYQVLGVPRDASEADIKKAYRRLARKYHPDVSKEADAEARMSEVNEANSVLSDPERRQAYDTLGNRHGAGDDFRPPPDWQQRPGRSGGPQGRGGFSGFDGFSGAGPEGFGQDFGGGPGNEADYSDFFSSLFGRRGAGGSRAGSTGAEPGGPGSAGPGGTGGPGGSGGMRFDGGDHHARVEITIAEAYHGGKRTLQLREADGGTRTLEVQLPQGVREGQLVRLAGQGMPGFNGGRAGNLYLEVHLLPDPELRVQGRDLYQRLPVTPWEAALGARVEAETLAGTIEVGVPANSQAGRKLRLKGKGMPGREPGDLYLELAVVLPPATSDTARALYEQMARELAFNPRNTSRGHQQEAST